MLFGGQMIRVVRKRGHYKFKDITYTIESKYRLIYISNSIVSGIIEFTTEDTGIRIIGFSDILIKIKSLTTITTIALMRLLESRGEIYIYVTPCGDYTEHLRACLSCIFNEANHDVKLIIENNRMIWRLKDFTT
jgi:hypothetical protein